MTEPKHPKVFVSHASEDKGRFVLDFARRLAGMGIEPWVDQWEMNPGDKLLDKIFNEGISKADAFIIVLSRYSVAKPWVREELDTALINRINKGTRLIPVVIDSCPVPEALQATVWQKIEDLDNYDFEFDRIVSAIYGHYDKPALGKPPSYTQHAGPTVPGLTKVDVIVLEEFGRYALDVEDHLALPTENVWRNVEPIGISRDQFLESCEVLSSRFYLKKGREVAPVPIYFEITDLGMESYLAAFMSEYHEIPRRVALAILNEDLMDNRELASRLGIPRLVIDHVLGSFENKHFVSVRRAFGGHVTVRKVLPELKRWLESGR